MSDPAEGLRERNRKRTMAGLEETALRLFAERGYECVTIDDIAAEAEVSRRTFFRYFPTKEDVLFGNGTRDLERLREAMAEQPAGETPLTALRRALGVIVLGYEQDRERLLRRWGVMAATPSLQARNVAQQRWAEQALTDLVAEWLGTDSGGDDLRPAIVAATALAATRVALTTWLAGGGQRHLPSLVAEALDLLDGGLQHGITITR
jgi:AcrR family transcriptional regulator